MTDNLTFAGIGSRETPPDIIDRMKVIAKRLAVQGYVLRTGGASGADEIFLKTYNEVGGPVELYLPWKGFNFHPKGFLPSKAAYDLAALYHPTWNSLSNGGKSLHARNMHQVLGVGLNDPVNFIVCWTKDGKASGGTGQALRLAESLTPKIPVYNLFNFLYDETIGLPRLVDMIK